MEAQAQLGGLRRSQPGFRLDAALRLTFYTRLDAVASTGGSWRVCLPESLVQPEGSDRPGFGFLAARAARPNGRFTFGAVPPGR